MPAFLYFVIVELRNVTLASNMAGLQELRDGLPLVETRPCVPNLFG
jgi:hypothetical protein